MGVRSRLVRFVRIDKGRRRLLMEAGVCLLLARIVLKALPFSLVARGLGGFGAPATGNPATASDRDAALARDVRWAVRHAVGHVPFQAVCLPQALAARIMLTRRRVGSVLHFGVTKVPSTGLVAHAWLDAAGVGVTGFPVDAEYAEIGLSIWPNRP